jgi:hypothetical protein
MPASARICRIHVGGPVETTLHAGLDLGAANACCPVPSAGPPRSGPTDGDH